MRLSPTNPWKQGLRRGLTALFILASMTGLAACAADLPVTAGAERRGVEQDLRVDGNDADLVPVHWMGVATDGTVALIQQQDHAVRYLDSLGNTLRTVGRSGSGPAEFGRLVRGGYVGDTLWLSDVEQQRITLIGPDGQVVRTLPALARAEPRPEDAGRIPVFHFVFPYAMYPGDTLLAVAMGAAGDPLAEAIKGTALVRVSADGVVDRIVLETPPNAGSLTIPIANGSANLSVPFFPRPHWAVSPDGSRIATVTTDVDGAEAGTYRVSAYTATGEQIFSKVVPFQAVAIPDGVADSVLQSQVQRAREPEVRNALEHDVKARIPRVFPPVEGLVVGADGRVWVGLRPTADGVPWLALGTDGEQQSEIVLPPNVALRFADAEHVWGLQNDDVDVQSVVRFRLLDR